jgi:GDPmannose 4,6-dehydratase
MTKKAIVTGVTGQDGSHLADFLIQKGYTVIGVVRRSSTNNLQRIQHLINNTNFIIAEGDIVDYSNIVNILKKYPDAIEFYNLAAQSHVATSFKQPGITWDITGKGCLNILQSIVDLNLQSKIKFYQASSSEMFGKNYDIKLEPKEDPSEQFSEMKYQNEDTKFMPQSPYAIAKCAAHYMTRLFREAYGLHASAGILFNHEGPRRGETFVTRKITKWIGGFVKWKNEVNPEDNPMVQGLPESDYIYGPNNSRFPKLRLGNLEAFRDWGYAGDYVEAMWMMLQQDIPDDYVICTGETHTIREFLDVAFSHIGITDWSDYVVQDPEFYRPAEVDYLRGVNFKAKQKLGWTPKHSFKDLVKLMVEGDLETSDYYEKLQTTI